MEVHGLERPPIPSRRIYMDLPPPNDSIAVDELPPSVPPVPVPAIPAEHAHLFSTPDPKRKSAPAGRSRRRVDNPTASPEVISSLIDSFSVFSSSDHDVGRASSRLSSAKSSPVPPPLRSKASFGASEPRSSLTDYEAYRQQLADDFAEPQAAEPPVVRTSKRPSGKSEWSAPKRPHESGLGSYLRNAYARSTSSLASSQRGDDDTRSIGNVSLSSTIRRRSIVSISRESLDNRLSAKKSHSKLVTPTRERFSSVDDDQVREVVLNATGAPEHLTPPSTSPRRRGQYDSTIQEEPPSPPYEAAEQSAKSQGKRPVSHDVVNGPAVPSRRSSLRHHEGSNSKRASQVSAHSFIDTLLEEQEPQTKIILTSFDGEPTEVTKRIRDLKAKKQLREREARLSPTPEPEYSTSPRLPISSASSPTLSQRETKASDKKNRIAQLGAINVPPRGKSKSPQIGAPINLHLPPQPATPLTPTPLPIDYSYIVQTLSKRDSTPNLREKEEKHKLFSLGLGGRSATDRSIKARTVVVDAPISVPENRIASPEPSERSSTDTNAKSDKLSGTSRPKRRRWSLPEAPAPIERRTSMKRNDMFAVQPLQRPEKIVEERPSSADSIDDDVKKFIHHPRLSQKIRHPQSGRTIAFSEVGDSDGHAVFCCVGMGLTRYVTAFYDELAMTLGLRLITPDRPGVGDTPSDPNGTPLSWSGTFGASSYVRILLTSSRRRTGDLSSPPHLEILHHGPQCRRNLRARNRPPHAPTHPRPRPPPRALDPPLANGAHRPDKTRPPTRSPAPEIPTLPARHACALPQDREYRFPKRSQREPESQCRRLSAQGPQEEDGGGAGEGE